MIEKFDLSQQVEIRVREGEYRSALYLWRKRPYYRTIFHGFIRQVNYDSRQGTRIEIEDISSRMRMIGW